MKILISEFITGGGLAEENLPSSLQKEGQMMLDAVVADFAKIPEIDLFITYDKRLVGKNISTDLDITIVESNYFSIFTELCDKVDAVLPIAPESDHILETLVNIIHDKKKIHLGSSSEAIKLTSSKLNTAKLLVTENIPVIKTDLVKRNMIFPESQNGWIVKPDQGVGSDQVTVCNTKDEIFMAASECENAIVQPYVDGVTASISMLCNQGRSVIIGYNEQVIEQQDNHLKFSGSKINAFLKYKQKFDSLASSIASVLPSLRGYVGIDLIIKNNLVFVVEINPRLTTSYVLLAESIEQNPAKRILDIFCENKLPELDHSKFKITSLTL